MLYQSIADRYRPVSYLDGPITARYRFIKTTYWVMCFRVCEIIILLRTWPSNQGYTGAKVNYKDHAMFPTAGRRRN